jgi:hypothetical protein
MIRTTQNHCDYETNPFWSGNCFSLFVLATAGVDYVDENHGGQKVGADFSKTIMQRQKRRRESGGVGSNSLPDLVALAVIATMCYWGHSGHGVASANQSFMTHSDRLLQDFGAWAANPT